MMSTEAVAIVSVYRMKSDRKSLSCFFVILVVQE